MVLRNSLVKWYLEMLGWLDIFFQVSEDVVRP